MRILHLIFFICLCSIWCEIHYSGMWSLFLFAEKRKRKKEFVAAKRIPSFIFFNGFVEVGCSFLLRFACYNVLPKMSILEFEWIIWLQLSLWASNTKDFKLLVYVCVCGLSSVVLFSTWWIQLFPPLKKTKKKKKKTYVFVVFTLLYFPGINFILLLSLRLWSVCLAWLIFQLIWLGTTF